MTAIAQRNIFLNSELTSFGNGESFRITVPSASFSCKSDQLMKLSLTSMQLRRNWHSINNTNNVFYLVRDNIYYPVIIPPGTYSAISNNTAEHISTYAVASRTDVFKYDTLFLVDAVCFALRKTFHWIQNGGVITDWNNAPAGVTSYMPEGIFTTAFINAVSVTYSPVKRTFTIKLPSYLGPQFSIRSFQLKNPAAFAGIHSQLQGYLSNSDPAYYGDWSYQDTHEIIGGIATRDNSVLTTSAYTSNGGATEFTGHFPVQLNSIEAIYLRLASTNTNNFQSPTIERGMLSNGILLPTPIFARIGLESAVADPINSIISWEDKGNNQFSTLFDGKHLDFIQLSLTDDKGRSLPEISRSIGAISIKCTLKWEIIQLDNSYKVPTNRQIIDSLSSVGQQYPTDMMAGRDAVFMVGRPQPNSKFSITGGNRGM